MAGLDQDSHRNLDALAAQLGQLQAQATRLNALGERLTQVGKLDDGEFDFGSDPAVGGPEEPATGVTMALPLQNGIDNLRAEFDRQQAQLDVLENLLRDRKIDNQLLPSGMIQLRLPQWPRATLAAFAREARGVCAGHARIRLTARDDVEALHHRHTRRHHHG